MAWQTDQSSDRRLRLPANWQQLREQVLLRCGGRCEIIKANGRRCFDKATDCDHIERGDDHSLSNLRGLCRWHHARKSAHEGGKANAAANAALKRPPEVHPGVIPPSQAIPLPRKGF